MKIAAFVLLAFSTLALMGCPEEKKPEAPAAGASAKPASAPAGSTAPAAGGW